MCAFAQKLLDWANHWLRPERQDMVSIMHSVILEQFTHHLPKIAKVWVQRHQPELLETTVKLAEEYVEADFPGKELPHSNEWWERSSS